MTTRLSFKRASEESLIVVPCQLDYGITKKDFKLCAYDFFSYHYLIDFDGVLGLDFFKGLKFCIDMELSEITIDNKSMR